ncbi:class I SAM-dependent methyltransferase [soil metagenome]
MRVHANVDAWSDAANYEPYMGRWSRRLASEFVSWLAVAPGARWLDFGCGTGALTTMILHNAQPASVLGLDPSAPYLNAACAAIRDPRASFMLGTADRIADQGSRFDAVVAGLVLNFVPDPRTVLTALRASLAGGGTFTAYVWDYQAMQMFHYFWDVASTFHASATRLQNLTRFSELSHDDLEKLMISAGFQDVVGRELILPMVFANFDDYWRPLLGRQGPASYLLGDLTVQDKATLGEAVRAVLPVESDGSIHLTARAWMVRAAAPPHPK